MTIERVFSISEEDTAGISAHSWIELRDDGYHLMNVELGHCGGPFPRAVDALTCDGTEYGGDYIELTCTLTPIEFAQIIQHINYSDSRMKVNDTEVEADFIAVMELYNSQQAAKLTGVDALMQPEKPPLTKSVDPAKGNSLLAKLFGSKLPIVQDPAPASPIAAPDLRDDDPNRPETEEDGFRAGQLRQLKVIHDARVARLRSIDPNLPQDEKDRFAAKINDEAEQRRALVLNKQGANDAKPT